MHHISRKQSINIYLLVFILSTSLLATSCGSKKRLLRETGAKELSQKLGFNIHHKDNIPLYTEAAKWLGTPYKYGGTTRKGVDCSGLVGQIYQNVYQITLNRTVRNIEKNNCRKISKHAMKPGDLVFFNTSKKKKGTNHVGIFLKHDYFIHASTSRGVVIDNLHESYYRKHWNHAGKIKK